MISFTSFIKKIPKQEDKAINNFIEYFKSDSKFPDYSDPELLIYYLLLKLTPSQTNGFQKVMIAYSQIETDNLLSIEYKENPDKLRYVIDLIVKFQNNDPKYPFKHLLPNKIT